MYKPIEGSNVVEIQGLSCNVPPIGHVFNILTDEIEPREIYQRSEKKLEQYWEVPPKPDNVKKRMRVEKQKRKRSANYFDVELQEYREQEWDRRINGFWFYFFGKPTYITGQHYFFLAHWTINGDYPKFRETDVEYHYFWEYCWNDPNCFGMLEVTQRRNGKSVRAGCCSYHRTSMAYNEKSGIQSKTDGDAERLFQLQIVEPWKKLEPMFIPTMDKSKGSVPKKMLSFNATSSSSRKDSAEIEIEQELESQIDFKASGEKAYDGSKQYVYISDECGKVEAASIHKRHDVVKPCMTVGSTIIGKMIYTTTVEDIGDSDKYDEGNFARLWDESDQLKVEKVTKQTVSGLYRYFLSAEKGFGYDEYGRSNVKENREYLMAQRQALSDNPTAKANFIRKYPFSIEEAFWTHGDECIYDIIKIENQKTIISQMSDKDLFIRGNLEWVGGKTGRGKSVEFIEHPKGRLKFNKKFNVYAECKARNCEISWDGKITPLFKHLRAIGVDPFDHKKVNTANNYTGSRAAAYLYFKYNIKDPLSETFVCQYLDRPRDFEIFHEDMVKLAFMSGAEVTIENNKQLLIRHFEDTGFKEFLYHHNNTPGVAANPKNHELLTKTTEIYINESIHKVSFYELLDDWSKFNLKKTTKFDAAMAAGWTLVGGYSDRIVSMHGTEKPDNVIYESTGFY